MTLKDDTEAVTRLTEVITPLLSGRSHLVQDATLANLLAVWLAMIPEAERQQALAHHLRCAVGLVACYDHTGEDVH